MYSLNVQSLLGRERQVTRQVRKEEEISGREILLPSFPASISPFHQQKTVCTIAAHEGALAAITFNASGSKLASASEKVSVLHTLTGCPPVGFAGCRPDETSLVTRSEFISGEEFLACCGILMHLLIQ